MSPLCSRLFRGSPFYLSEHFSPRMVPKAPPSPFPVWAHHSPHLQCFLAGLWPSVTHSHLRAFECAFLPASTSTSWHLSHFWITILVQLPSLYSPSALLFLVQCSSRSAVYLGSQTLPEGLGLVWRHCCSQEWMYSAITLLLSSPTLPLHIWLEGKEGIKIKNS